MAAYAVFLRAGVTPDYPAVLLPTMLLVGLAFGLGFSALSVAATDGMPERASRAWLPACSRRRSRSAARWCSPS